MKIAVPRERAPGERRVALIPETVAKYTKNGIAVVVEQDAGRSAGFPNEAYLRAGATIASTPAELYGDADVVARVAKPSDEELNGIKPGTTLIGFLAPLGDPSSVERYAAFGLTALSMDAIPRTTKAQSMDALSSQAISRATKPPCSPPSRCRASSPCSRRQPERFHRRRCS
jgi:NAD(P) transhydrogenase subunit alpha